MQTTGGAYKTDAVTNMGDADSATTSTNSVGATCRCTKACMSPVAYSTTGEACAYVTAGAGDIYTTTEMCRRTERDRSVRGGQRTVRRRDRTVSAAIGALTIGSVAVGRTVGAAVIVVTGVA